MSAVRLQCPECEETVGVSGDIEGARVIHATRGDSSAHGVAFPAQVTAQRLQVLAVLR